MPLPLFIGAAGFAGIAATAVKFIVGYTLVRVVAALGISLITFGAVDLITVQIESYISNNITGVGGQFWEVAVTLNVPHAVKVITSAYVGAISIRQLMGIYNRVTFGKSAT